MLAVVQFPLVDVRAFGSGPPRRVRPVPWTALQRGQSFVPGFGCAGVQRPFEDVPAPWRDDSQYVHAAGGVRLRGQAVRCDLPAGLPTPDVNTKCWAYRAPAPASGAMFLPAFRRLHADGIAMARVDIGFWVLGGGPLQGDDTLRVVRDLLSLQAEVTRPTPSGRRTLRTLGKPLAQGYEQATRRQRRHDPPPDAPAEPAAADVRAGALAVFLDDLTGTQNLPRRPEWLRPFAEHLGMPDMQAWPDEATPAPADATGGVGLAHTVLAQDRQRVAVWMVGGPRPPGAPAPTGAGLHPCLMRLHAMRQTLSMLLTMSAAGRIGHRDAEPGTDAFTTYLQALATQVLRPSAYGQHQDALQRIVSLYDLADDGQQRGQLEAALEQLPLQRDIRSRILAACAPSATSALRPHYVIQEVTVNHNEQTITISPTGGSSVSLGDVNQAGGNVNTQLAAPDPAALQAALLVLQQQVDALSAKLAGTPAQQQAARRLKQLTEEASAPDPDPEVLKVTGKGLVEAAKAVAEMVGPIGTAVAGVLSIFKLAL